MSRPVPPAPPRRVAHFRSLSAVGVACIGGLLGPASSPAAPVTVTVKGHHQPRSVPAERRIKTLAATVDPAVGSWSATVTFAAPQTTTTAAGLGAAITTAGRRQPNATWFTRTNPEALSLQYANPFAVSSDATTMVAYDATRTALTVQATDPQLVGRRVSSIMTTLYDPDVPEDGTYSNAQAFFGPGVPPVRIPPAAKRLIVDRGGTLRIPLSPLSARATRTVSVELPHHLAVFFRSVPKGAYRRRSVSQRLLPEALRHLSRTPRRATLVIRTSLPNGNTSRTTATVSIRRR